MHCPKSPHTLPNTGTLSTRYPALPHTIYQQESLTRYRRFLSCHSSALYSNTAPHSPLLSPTNHSKPARQTTLIATLPVCHRPITSSIYSPGRLSRPSNSVRCHVDLHPDPRILPLGHYSIVSLIIAILASCVLRCSNLPSIHSSFDPPFQNTSRIVAGDH